MRQLLTRLRPIASPRTLVSRLAARLTRQSRLAKMRGTVAARLRHGHIDSLELLELCRSDHPRVIYDVGAHVGTWTLLAKALFPSCVVHAFEPLADHGRQFQLNTKGIPGVTLHPIALGAAAGGALLHVADFTDASSLLPFGCAVERGFGVHKEREDAISVAVLDEYVESQSVVAPDLLKLDVQGFEVEVLKGGRKCLESARHVITEVSFVEYYVGQPLFHEVVDYLQSAGFYLRAFGVNTPLGAELTQADALFSRERR